MRSALKSTIAVSTVGAVAALGLGLAPSVASAESDRGGASSSSRGGLDVVGLSSDGKELVRFDTRRSSRTDGRAHVRGLVDDTRLVGIDYRVQDGALYGVGEHGGVYRLHVRSGAATLVVRLSVALEGSSFGVDFNPVANALRVVSDTGQNLRQSFVTVDNAYPATAVDGALNYTAGTTATGITAVAYTNNDTDLGTATTLFDIDSALDQVAIQAPANAGSLSPTGTLGVDLSSASGFDIYSVVRGGRAVGLVALAVDRGALYQVGLLDGSARRIGSVDHGVTDIAIPLGQRSRR